MLSVHLSGFYKSPDLAPIRTLLADPTHAVTVIFPKDVKVEHLDSFATRLKSSSGGTPRYYTKANGADPIYFNVEQVAKTGKGKSTAASFIRLSDFAGRGKTMIQNHKALAILLTLEPLLKQSSSRHASLEVARPNGPFKGSVRWLSRDRLKIMQAVRETPRSEPIAVVPASSARRSPDMPATTSGADGDSDHGHFDLNTTRLMQHSAHGADDTAMPQVERWLGFSTASLEEPEPPSTQKRLSRAASVMSASRDGVSSHRSEAQPDYDVLSQSDRIDVHSVASLSSDGSWLAITPKAV